MPAVSLSRLPELSGQPLGHTEWREMTQERVDAFADVTEDHNYIHVDPERAKDTPFGGTIAHGYLTVSLLAPITQSLLEVSDAKTSINYGMDKLRFPARCRWARSSAARRRWPTWRRSTAARRSSWRSRSRCATRSGRRSPPRFC